MIYLDNAATTFPKPEKVYLEMDKANREYAVNAGRGAYRTARKANQLIVETKNLLRKLVSADITMDVIFSPSITVALNQVIRGYKWKEKDVIYVSPYEHNAVARTLHYLQKEKDIIIKQLPLNANTLEIDLEKIKYEFSKENPNAIFCTHVSNVTGYILPIEQIFAEGKKYNSLNVLDTAQSLGLISLDVRNCDVDIVAFAGHKTLYGPFGIGGFINVGKIELNEVVTGGTGSDSLNLDMPKSGEGKYESASSNIVAISGLHAALEVLEQKERLFHEKELTTYLVNKLEAIEEVKLYLPQDRNKHISIVSFTFEVMSSEDLGMLLDEDFDIAVRTGYHCAPYIHKYLKDEKSLGTVRVGIGQFTTKEDIDTLVEVLEELF